MTLEIKPISTKLSENIKNHLEALEFISELAKEQAGSSICPDHDKDCQSMSNEKATWCYTGCQGHSCSPDPNNSLGTAKGYCPIIHKAN